MGIPFECDLCHFRNMTLRNPVVTDPKDAMTLVTIRRASLDALWAREPGTVQGNLSRAVRDHREAAAVCSLERGELPYLPSPELKDRVGMTSAVYVLRSAHPERPVRDRLQFRDRDWQHVQGGGATPALRRQTPLRRRSYLSPRA